MLSCHSRWRNETNEFTLSNIQTHMIEREDFSRCAFEVFRDVFNRELRRRDNLAAPRRLKYVDGGVVALRNFDELRSICRTFEKTRIFSIPQRFGNQITGYIACELVPIPRLRHRVLARNQRVFPL